MRCHVCNIAVGDDQRFCHECGAPLDGVTDPTETLDVVDEETTHGIGDEIDDEVTVETDPPKSGSADDGDPLLPSETVTPPAQPEPAPVVDQRHRGALPDLAAPPTDPDNDEAWWAESGGSPEPDDDLPNTEPVEVIAASPPIRDHDPLAATEALDVTAPSAASTDSTGNSLDSVPYAPMGDAPSTPEHEPTTTMPSVGAGPALGVTDELPHGGPEPTSQMAATRPGGLFDGGEDVQEYGLQSEGFRLRFSFVLAFLAMVATLMASVADVIDIRTTRPVDGIVVGIRALDDFGSNLAVAGFVGAALMLIGGLLSCFGLRWGAGLAGGAGLSMTGWAAVTLGLVELPIHSAEGETARADAIAAFTLSVTRDLGYFLILSVGIIGMVVFVVSLRMAGTGGRGGLNPWIAAVGALAAVVLAAGPLITLGGGPLDANLGVVGFPKEFFAGRLVQIGLIAVTGVLGFLSVRTYGLGLAAGGIGVATWMWVTSLAELGDQPISIAVGNLGTEIYTTHAVTTVGVTASLAMLLIAATIATVTRRRA